MTARRLLRRARTEGGFTLIELSVTMAVLGIFLAAVALVLGGAIRNSSQVEDAAITQTEARSAVDGLAAELRQAYTDSALGTYAIQTATSSTLTFYTPDRRSSPMHVRRVSYRVSGGELQRAFATSTNTVAGPPWPNIAAANLGSYKRLVGTVTNTTPFTYWKTCTTPGSGGCGTDYLQQLTGTILISDIAVVRTTLTVSPRGSQGRTSTYIVNTSLRIG